MFQDAKNKQESERLIYAGYGLLVILIIGWIAGELFPLKKKNHHGPCMFTRL